ncbi:MAG: DUF2799 domain-containing protein [Neisseria sp.]|nr:DUF2799 domain-containing protein [Neisseria sp.]
MIRKKTWLFAAACLLPAGCSLLAEIVMLPVTLPASAFVALIGSDARKREAETVCRAGYDWHQSGFEAGERGRGGVFEEYGYDKLCDGRPAKPDRAKWEHGYHLGLAKYCSEGHFRQLGRDGDTRARAAACPNRAELEKIYREAYEEGAPRRRMLAQRRDLAKRLDELGDTEKLQPDIRPYARELKKQLEEKIADLDRRLETNAR